MQGLLILALLSSVIVLVAPKQRSGDGSPEHQQEEAGDLTPVEQNGKWGYADKDGHLAIKPQFSEAHGFSEGLALVSAGGAPLTDPVVKSFVKMGYIDKKGQWVILSRFKYYFYYDFSEGLVPFRQLSHGWGYMDRTGRIAVRPRFQWAGAFSNGVAPVLSDNKCGHIDKTGRITDRSQSELPHRKFEQDRRGTFRYKPNVPPCS